MTAHNAGRFHPGDPFTSKAAAKALDVGSGQWRVLSELAGVDPAVGLTDYELAGRLGMLATAAGTRRKELEELGHVVTLVGVRRPTDSGRTAAAHAITASGREQYLALRSLKDRHADAPRSSTPDAAGRPKPGRRSRRGLTAPLDRALEEYLDAPDGLTDYELGRMMGTLRTTAGSRRLELEAAGYVQRLDRQRRTDRQRLAYVAIITVAGIEHLGELVRAADKARADKARAMSSPHAAGAREELLERLEQLPLNL